MTPLDLLYHVTTTIQYRNVFCDCYVGGKDAGLGKKSFKKMPFQNHRINE